MTRKSSFGAVGLAVVLMSGACAQTSPTEPTSAVVSNSDDSLAVTTSIPLVTLRPDLTVSPNYVEVKAGGKIKMFNNTTRPTQIQSSNCWEFNLMALPAGYSKYSQAFSPAGKTCEFWAMNSGQKIFVGRVAVK